MRLVFFIDIERCIAACMHVDIENLVLLTLPEKPFEQYTVDNDSALLVNPLSRFDEVENSWLKKPELF